MDPLPEALHQEATELYREYLLIGGLLARINIFLNCGSADIVKYSRNTDSVKIRVCYNSIPAQLAKDNKKF